MSFLRRANFSIIKTFINSTQLSRSLTVPNRVISISKSIAPRNYSTEALKTNSNTNLIISNTCLNRLKELAQSKKYLRIFVDSGGCSGFEYKFTIDTAINPDDQIIEKNGCRVLVDTDSLDFLKGATLDYYEELIRTGFRIIDNPNAGIGCSCGTSFGLKV